MFIFTKYYQIPKPDDGKEATYLVEMRIRYTGIANPDDDPPEIHDGGLLLLSSSYETYINSYVVNITQQDRLPLPPGSYNSAVLTFTKLVNNVSKIQKSTTIPTTIYERGEETSGTHTFQFIRIKSYIHINNKHPPATTPSTLISSYLYYDGYKSGDTGKTPVPFEKYVSEIDNSVSPYIKGYIGFVGGYLNHPCIELDWIRVTQWAPSFQPIATPGAIESLNYGWQGATIPSDSTESTSENPFSPDPVHRDAVLVPEGAEFAVWNLLVKDNTVVWGYVTVNYVVTITVGDNNLPTPECSLQWGFNGTQGETLYSPHSITLPATVQGEFKDIQFTIDTTEPQFPGGGIIDYLSVFGLTLKLFDIDESSPIQQKAIAAITIERVDDSFPSLLNIKGGTIDNLWKTQFEYHIGD
jgi:hypothetical protein